MDQRNGEKNMRVKQLQSLMIENKVDHCILSDPSSMSYFVDKQFSCGERLNVLLVNQTGIPKMFLNDLFPCSKNEQFEIIRFNDTVDAVKLLAENLNGNVIGIDKNWNAGFLLKLQSYLRECKFVSASTLSDKIRSIKMLDEQEKMRKSSLINDEVMQIVKESIHLGMTEIELANVIDQLFLDMTGCGPAFETIVAFKENCADPHAVPSVKMLEEGMSIIVDMGCKYEGYCSDMTRTFFFKENTMKEIYDLVLNANLAAIAKVKPGISFKEIDLAARNIISEAGYGEYFIHRTGHGIGLSGHEPYDVSSINEMLVEEGMCFSIEPGIYIPNVGGVRIEDLVLVTKEGCEVLNHYPKDDPVIS